MKEKFVNSSIKFISKYEECDDLKIKKLQYGLQGIYSLIIKLIAIITISIIIKTWKETLLFLLFFTAIRSYGHGIHAKTNLGCWTSSITIYNILPYIIKKLTIPKEVEIAILIIGFISAILWAPADTPQKPLIRKNQRIKCKIIMLIILIFYTIIYFFNKNILINNALVYSVLIGSLIINPVIYKLNKTQFNNYKHYHKKS